MAKKQQSTQQPSRKDGEQQNERLWNTSARPITPTADTPTQPESQPPAQPAQPESQPAAEQPTQPASNPQPSTKKD